MTRNQGRSSSYPPPPAGPAPPLPPGYPSRPGRAATGGSRDRAAYVPAAAPDLNRQGLTLTGAGAVVLLTLAGALGAIIDLLFGPGLGPATTVLLPIGALAASWLVRRSALFWILIAPPPVFLAVLAGSLLITAGALTLPALAAGLVYGFPAMALATAVGVAIMSLRQITRR